MIRDKRPRIALGLSFFKNNGKALKKSFPVFIVFEDFTAFNSPCHYMLQQSMGVKSWLAWHDKSSKMQAEKRKEKIKIIFGNVL